MGTLRVLAIDPGYDRLGVAVLELSETKKERLLYSACITTDRGSALPERLLALGNSLEMLLHEYKPSLVGIEKLFFNKNSKTAMGVAEARGAILFLVKRFGSIVREFSPQEIKVAVTGYGNSDKRAVYTMIQKLISGVPEGALDDEYDAIAVGITCLAHERQ